LKHTIAALSCTAALVASLTACGSEDDKPTLPSNTSGSTPSTTTTSRPVPTPATATTGSGPVALDTHSTYTYGGLKVVVNLPADIPSASRPSMRLFSEFLQADGRTTARSKLDPSLSGLASADVVKDTKASITAGSVQGIGSVIYTVSKVQTAGRTTLVAGCLDQSKIVHLRKDGSHFVDANARKYPRIKMTANINRALTGPEVTLFTFADGTC
jgi:hypothetical protein